MGVNRIGIEKTMWIAVWIVGAVFVVAVMAVVCYMALRPIVSAKLPPLPSTGDPWKDVAQKFDRASKLWNSVGH
jgi:hypothetical protein